MDTTGDPCLKEFDRLGKKEKIVSTVKRLTKPWFFSGRTVIADSWFGSPKMAQALTQQGLFSIMEVAKRRYYPTGMPLTDVKKRVEEEEYGTHYTMAKEDGSMLVCAINDLRAKVFVSTCGTTALTSERSFRGPDGGQVTFKRPDVIEEYERHKSSVDAANNLRDNLPSYHDIIMTERWEMRFFGFFLGMCEANAYSAYRVFAKNGHVRHSDFKDTLAWTLLKHCEELARGPNTDEITRAPVFLRSHVNHKFLTMHKRTNGQRVVIRKVCKTCNANGNLNNRVSKFCACNFISPMCADCHQTHVREVWSNERAHHISL